MTHAYSTLADIKSTGWLNITVTSYDTDLLRFLQDASVLVDRMCHRQFQANEGTRYIDGSSSPLMLREIDLLSLTSFALDQDGSQNYATALATTDYVLYPLNSFPKTYIKTSHIASVGSFASGIRSGVKLIGTFGYGDGESATPYTDSTAVVNTGGITISALTHALATGKGALFSAGNTIRIGTEQLYITSMAADTLMFKRAQNGTTAAAHTSGDVIYIYQYPGPIVEAALLQASRDWKRKDSPTAAVVGSAETGIVTVSKGLDPDIAKHIETYIKRVL